MTTVVWIPYRATKERAEIFNAVRPFVESLGYPVIIADSGHQPFSIGNSWNLCAAESERYGWTRAIQWGADFLIENPDSIHAAVELSRQENLPHVKAFDKVSRLTLTQTQAWLAGEPVELPDSPLPFEGPLVVSREAYETVGGNDPRFVGWGHEDRAFTHCIHVLCGPTVSVPGRMIMLRHPGREAMDTDPYYANRHKNQAIWAEYEAITDPDQLRAHIAAVR